jgi:predicted CopG family antitoxin
MNKLKHITVGQEVYQKLKDLGRAGDSFNDVLLRILASVEKEGKKKFD